MVTMILVVSVVRECNSFIAQTVVQVCPGTTTFNDRNLPRDTWYSYRVSAFNRPGNSAYSNVLSIATPL